MRQYGGKKDGTPFTACTFRSPTSSRNSPMDTTAAQVRITLRTFYQILANSKLMSFDTKADSGLQEPEGLRLSNECVKSSLQHVSIHPTNSHLNFSTSCMLENSSTQWIRTGTVGGESWTELPALLSEHTAKCFETAPWAANEVTQQWSLHKLQTFSYLRTIIF